MKLKRILCLILAAVMLPVLSGCSVKEDWDYISGNKKMIVGITYFAPMNYKDTDGSLTGFETEFATAVCEKLGITPEFQVIDWNSKVNELDAKNIDCIWNGMTVNASLSAVTAISVPYMRNKQVMVALSDKMDLYLGAAAADLAGVTVVAEQGSAGEGVATSDELFAQANYTAVDTQAKALMEIAAGTADIAVIDYVMTIGSIGEGTSYTNISVVEGMDFAPEEYGIAFRKGSDVTLEKVNAAIQELADDGTLDTIARKYKLEDLILIEAQ